MCLIENLKCYMLIDFNTQYGQSQKLLMKGLNYFFLVMTRTQLDVY